MKEPLQRTCMGCNTKKNKKELIRIVRTDSKEIEIDLTFKKNGRGAYLCKDTKCLEKVIKTKRLAKSLKIEIKEEDYDKIRGVIFE